MRLIDADVQKALIISSAKEEGVEEGTVAAKVRDFLLQALDEAQTIEAEPVIHAVWHYYTNDEGRARWSCTHCGKVCHKHPHDKQRCSVCGAHMRMEA